MQMPLKKTAMQVNAMAVKVALPVQFSNLFLDDLRRLANLAA